MAAYLGRETEWILFLIKMKFKNILNNTVSQHIVTTITGCTWKSLSKNAHPFKLTWFFFFIQICVYSQLS